MPMSTTSTPGTSFGCTRSGGSNVPPLACGRAPSASLRSESVSGATSVCARRRHEGLQIGFADRRRIADFRGQRHRLDAQQPERPSLDLDPAFEHRRDRPAGAAQVDEEFLRKACAAAADQHGGARAAKRGGGAIVGVARLLIERLHAAPQRGRRDQSDQQGRKLHRMPPPMAEQHGQHPQRALHAISPAWRLTCRSSVAASLALCVTIRKPQPLRVTRSRASASTSSAVSSSRLPVGSSASSSSGFDRQRPADRDALLLAAGQLLGIAFEQTAEPEPLHQFVVPGRHRDGRRCATGIRDCPPP